jgi:hypothetical protein
MDLPKFRRKRQRRSAVKAIANLFALGAFFVLSACGQGDAPVNFHVQFKLVDDDNKPIAGVPLRFVIGVPNWNADGWRAPNTGVRIVTDKDGAARFTTEGAIDRTWTWVNLGFTPFSMPVRVHHAGVGFEVERVLPSRQGDITHRWFYTADINRHSNGDSSTDDLDRIYEVGPDGRFTRLLAKSVSSPQSVIAVDGLMLRGSGYNLADFALDPVGDGTKEWTLTLALKQHPKPVLR